MNLRHPIVAGSYYEAGAASCRHHAAKLLAAARLPDDLPRPLYGGLAPHAGWTYSGALAALTIKALLAEPGVRSIVLLSAHVSHSVDRGQVYDSGVWRTPLGDVQIDEELARALIEASTCLAPVPRAHDADPSLEVQVPLLQALRPDIRIVPIAVPPTGQAARIGQVLGSVLKDRIPPVPVIGSTDLTHHGGDFGAPGGRGPAGAAWTEANDRRMLDLIEAMAADKIIPEYRRRSNACGPGAVTAAITAAKALGAKRGLCLGYTNSYRVIHEQFPDESDDTTVGYASVVFA
jgi:hypothetical protein